MAVISKIRSKAGLLIGIVGFSLFAFILGDLLHNNRNIFGGNDTTVGVISGKKFNVQDFEARVQTFVTNYKLNNNTETVDQNTMDQLREQAWTQLVNDEVMGKQYEKIGLNVSADELFDMVHGKNPHPQVKQAFTDPKTGQFNSAAVMNFLKNMDNDQTGRTRAQWLVFEKAIQQERLQQKYNDLIKQGMYVSTEEALADWTAKNHTYSVRYVMVPYSSITDTTVQISDAELKAAYTASMKKFKQQASRAIEYVTFDVVPSQIDREVAVQDFNKLVEPFKTTTSDSLFVAQNSDSPFDNTYHKKGSLAPSIDSIAFNAAIGTVIGPYEEGGMLRMAKITGSKVFADSVKARHILLKMDPAKKDEIMVRADSIKKAVSGGAPFELLSTVYSTDDAAKAKGGDLGTFAQGAMVKEFNDACFNAKKGDVFVVTTQFGVHIVQINDMKGSSKMVQVAFVDHKVEPSSKTYQTVYTKANEFAAKNITADAFDKAVKDQNLTKLNETNILESSRQVGPLENSRELIRWSFGAKVSDISKAFEFGNRFCVAKLTDVRERGYSTLEQVKDQVMMEARRDKKAEQLIEKVKKAGNGSNLDALAASLGTTAQVADNVSFASPFLGNAGMEGAVVGHIVAMKAGQVSAPLKGMNGVYVVSVTTENNPPAPKVAPDNAKQLAQQNQQRAQYEVYNALREKADIDDRRGKFY